MKRLVEVAVLTVVSAAVAGGIFLLGFRAGRLSPEHITVAGVTGIEPDQQAATADFGTFWQAWDTINSDYLRNASTTNQDKVYGAIRGLVESLHDPYSEFFDPKENQQFTQDVQGNFGGIGAEIGVKNGQIVVISPLKNTPASRAGLTANDAILAINGSSTDSMSVDEAVQRIRGTIGTIVTLTIYRDGWDKEKDFKIARATIEVPTIDYSMKDGDVAVVALHEFNGNADLDFYKTMFTALTHGAKGMVLDLRDDPGGYLETAVNIAGWFVPRGTVVVSEATRNGVDQVLRADGNEALVHIPVVVLINGGSASASEILAGALRDDRHAKLVGEKSFGKGTVQQLEDLGDGSTIKLTIAHWVMPSGEILENGGITPDVVVTSTPDEVTAGHDAQLDKALEIVKSEIK